MNQHLLNHRTTQLLAYGLSTARWKQDVVFQIRREPILAALLWLAVLIIPSQTSEADPAPRLLGSWPGFTRGEAKATAVAGNYAYVVAGSLQVIDVSEPAKPRRVGATAESDGEDVAVSDGIAFVASGANGLRVFDVGDPTRPRLIGTVVGRGEAFAVAFSDHLAYVAEHWRENDKMQTGLRVIEVTDPTRPHSVGTWIGPEGGMSVWGCDLAVSGRYVYLTTTVTKPQDETGWLVAIDVRDPRNPIETGWHAFPGRVNGLAVSGGYAYVTGRGRWDGAVGYYRDGLSIIDVSNHVIDITKAPFLPRIGGFETGEYSRKVAVSGPYAYLADGSGGLRVIDITDPVRLIEVGAYETSGVVDGVAILGNNAYLLERLWDEPGLRFLGRLTIVDISNPKTPSRIGSADLKQPAAAIGFFGNYAYLANGDAGLQVIDVSDLSNPELVGVNETGRIVQDLKISGDYLFLAGDWLDNGGWRSGLQVLNIGDPIHPETVSTVESRNASAVEVAGGYAFVQTGDWGGSDRGASPVLSVIDASNPANARLAVAYQLDRVGIPAPLNLVIANFAFSGGNVYDLSDPTSPRRIGRWDRDGGHFITEVGDFGYSAAGSQGLQVIRLPMLHFSSNRVLDTGGIKFVLTGDYGQRVRVQRSKNLVDWEEWKTLTLTSSSVELIDDTAATTQRFYRAVESANQAAP
ncbi:MAG: hypothetical protein K9N62_02030 [Verrucomicrobia bacterium]|nr:hypothetical protein [Verrucomicrobiota bacterium]